MSVAKQHLIKTSLAFDKLTILRQRIALFRKPDLEQGEHPQTTSGCGSDAAARRQNGERVQDAGQGIEKVGQELASAIGREHAQ